MVSCATVSFPVGHELEFLPPSLGKKIVSSIYIAHVIGSSLNMMPRYSNENLPFFYSIQTLYDNSL